MTARERPEPTAPVRSPDASEFTDAARGGHDGGQWHG